jgi:NDP-sugar pyrophosphorylase family protein
MQLYPQLISKNPAAIAAHVVEAPFCDVGTLADYLQTSLEFAASEGDRLVSHAGVAIHASADVRRTAVWDGATIGAHSRIEDCIVCDGVTIPAGSRYERCAIAPHGGEAPRSDERVEGALLIKQF